MPAITAFRNAESRGHGPILPQDDMLGTQQLLIPFITPRNVRHSGMLLAGIQSISWMPAKNTPVKRGLNRVLA